MILSVLICSLYKRSGLLSSLMREVQKQTTECGAGSEVELLVEIDAGELSTGVKRKKLLEKATGRYVIYIDDDDEIYSYYIKELLEAAKSGSDCFAINGIMTTNGDNLISWRLSKNYQNETINENGVNLYLRHTNHITAVKRDIALQSGFPDLSCGEDKGYSEGLRGLLQTECVIIPPMYHYRYSSINKEY